MLISLDLNEINSYGVRSNNKMGLHHNKNLKVKQCIWLPKNIFFGSLNMMLKIFLKNTFEHIKVEQINNLAQDYVIINNF